MPLSKIKPLRFKEKKSHSEPHHYQTQQAHKELKGLLFPLQTTPQNERRQWGFLPSVPQSRRGRETLPSLLGLIPTSLQRPLGMSLKHWPLALDHAVLRIPPLCVPAHCLANYFGFLRHRQRLSPTFFFSSTGASEIWILYVLPIPGPQ